MDVPDREDAGAARFEEQRPIPLVLGEILALDIATAEAVIDVNGRTVAG